MRMLLMALQICVGLCRFAWDVFAWWVDGWIDMCAGLEWNGLGLLSRCEIACRGLMVK